MVDSLNIYFFLLLISNLVVVIICFSKVNKIFKSVNNLVTLFLLVHICKYLIMAMGSEQLFTVCLLEHFFIIVINIIYFAN